MALSTDPFLWDVDEVVSNLCRPRSSWTSDPTLLAATIREEEIDGRLLLTAERTMSKDALLQCLGIKKFRHKAALTEELTRLRSQSSLYKRWSRDFIKRQQLLDDNDGASDGELDISIDTIAKETVVPHSPKLGGAASSQNMTPHAAATGQADEPLNGIDAGPAIGPDTRVPSRPSSPRASAAGETPAGPPVKKRRVAPMNTTAQPFTTRIEITNPWEHSQPWSYLGRGKIPADAVRSPDTQLSTWIMDTINGGFMVLPTRRLPPGRQLAVGRIMKQVMRKNGYREALIRQGIVPEEFSNASSVADDEELDLANLPDWDEQTWQEILEEEEDNKRTQELDRSLSLEQVEAAIAGAVEGIKKKWEERKLPKLERRAYKIWTTAMRRGDKLQHILKARQQASAYETRIKGLMDRIKGERWKDEREVRLQAQCLEQSVEDQLQQLWRITTLELRQPPPKPNLLPRPPVRSEQSRVIDPDDEVLTSTDEEDGFVVPDEPVAAVETPTKQSRGHIPTTPVKEKSPMQVDLTQSSTRRRQKSGTFIDLTTPVKGAFELPEPSQESQPPPQESQQQVIGPPALGDIDVEDIAKESRKYWSARSDRWRLTIYILRHLPHERRSAVLTRIVSSDDEELWSYCIEQYIENQFSAPEELIDIEGRSERFDLTRAFFCFSVCRYLGEERFAPLKARHARTLRASESLFSGFCNFLRNIVDLFPQDSQIMDTGQLDDIALNIHDGDLLQVEEDDPASPQRANRSAKKQIVQNREAVNLRERERLRGQEQEARRIKLRQTLATGEVAQDKTRLIINESKEEGQSLIYVNSEIGKQIKDHQIEGVRFLWNQIVQDKDIRQGCLLAHTMGLGKTMQVITLLVALAEASASDDPRTKCQIPEDLQLSRTLILCPSGLVENWMDEILKWAPGGLLGRLWQLDATITSSEVRKEVVHKWGQDGGVLIIGYPMLQSVMKDDEVRAILVEKTVVVVADEAHKLKNPNAKVSRACAELATSSRIALTGSPLANNVEEYYSMINWVAPNFLGPIDEFRDVYARDIHAGCYRDSDSADKRRALVRLQALKETVAPKVNRATVKSCLLNDLPAKTEFVISLTPTDTQVELYNMYIEALGAGSAEELEQGRVFGIVNDLALICNHPFCFYTRLREVRQDGSRGKPTFHASFPRDVIDPALRVFAELDKSDPVLSLKTKLLTIILDESRRLGDKVLVFSQSLKTLDYLEKLLSEQGRTLWRLDGSTNIQTRQNLTKTFNKQRIEVGLISTTAGGVGLNIQGANRVVIFDSRWNPVDVQQAVGRAYRIGQQKKVYVYHFLLAGTFEESIHNRAVFKQQLAQRVVDKKNPISWSHRQPDLIHPVKKARMKDIKDMEGKDVILDMLIAFRRGEGSNEQLIASIVPTDTFEEEDPTNILTEKEKQAADEIVSLNRLRLTDPERYERMRGAQQIQNLTGVYAPPPSSAPIPAPSSSMAPQPPSTAPPGMPTANSHGLSSSQPPSSSTTSHRMDGAYDGHDYPAQPNAWHTARSDVRQIPGLQAHHLATSHPHLHPYQVHDASGAARQYQPQPQPSHPQPPHPRPYPFMGSAPLPTTGAHTYFGSSKPTMHPTPPQHPQHGAPRRAQNPPEPRRVADGTFGQPMGLEKSLFATRIREAVQRVQRRGQGVIDAARPAEDYAQPLIRAIDGIRQQKQLGFLPDNQQWKHLSGMLDDDRFVMSAISGHISAKFLALSDESELQRRASTINGLTEEEFRMQMHKLLRQQPPQATQEGHNTHWRSREAADVKSRREAADNRWRRHKELPSWAQEAYKSRP